MNVRTSTKLKLVFCICALVLLVDSTLGGVSRILFSEGSIAIAATDMLMSAASCFLFWFLQLYFRTLNLKNHISFTKTLFIAYAIQAPLILLTKGTTLDLSILVSLLSIVILFTTIIWFLVLFLNAPVADNAFPALKHYATVSLVAAFCSLALGANLLHSTDVYGNIVSGDTFMYQVPQMIQGVPYVFLIRFALKLKPETVQAELTTNTNMSPEND